MEFKQVVRAAIVDVDVVIAVNRNVGYLLKLHPVGQFTPWDVNHMDAVRLLVVHVP